MAISETKPIRVIQCKVAGTAFVCHRRHPATVGILAMVPLIFR